MPDNLTMHPNFSQDPLDQFDIVNHFESSDSWKKFIIVLTYEMEMQNTSSGDAVPQPLASTQFEMQANNGLDALLNNLLGPTNLFDNNYNNTDNKNNNKNKNDDDSDSDSDSDEDIFGNSNKDDSSA